MELLSLLHPDAELALIALRLLGREQPVDLRYLAFRRLVLLSSATPTLETVYALARAGKSGTRSIGPAVMERLRQNSALLLQHSEAGHYESPADEALAERNVMTVLGEFDLLARGMVDDVADRLVRPLVTSKTDAKTGFEAQLPFRADGYSIFAIEPDMTKPSIRVWATKTGVAVGAHFGCGRKYDDNVVMASSLRSLVAEPLQFFEVLPHKSGDRLRPAGNEPQRNELFVGEWFPDGVSAPGGGNRIMGTVARLQPVFDAMVAATSGVPTTPPPPGGDPLATRVQQFLAESGYPTESDNTHKAERERMTRVISEDGLLAFDPHEFRRIYNSSRYGNPGPQAGLNSSLGQMNADQMDTFARSIDYLLRSPDSIEDRINSLLDPSDRGIKGPWRDSHNQVAGDRKPFHSHLPLSGRKGKGTDAGPPRPP